MFAYVRIRRDCRLQSVYGRKGHSSGASMMCVTFAATPGTVLSLEIHSNTVMFASHSASPWYAHGWVALAGWYPEWQGEILWAFLFSSTLLFIVSCCLPSDFTAASELQHCTIRLQSGTQLHSNGFGRAMRWYVLRSKPNKEDALYNEVDARALQALFPCLHVKPVNPRSRKTRAYFPGYLFVRVNLKDVGQGFFSRLPYSQGLVCFGGEPSEVPDGLVQAIRKRVDEINAAGGEQLVNIQKGETVEITDGPFAGYQAIFDARVAGNERVRVLLKLLQAQTLKVELPAAQIKQTKRS